MFEICHLTFRLGHRTNLWFFVLLLCISKQMLRQYNQVRSANLHVILLTYSMVQSPSWAANWFAASQKFPAFHGTRIFITALTSVRHLSLSWASPIQSIYLHPTSWKFILILSTHLRLGLSSGLFPHQGPIHPPLLTHVLHVICHSLFRYYKSGSRSQWPRDLRRQSGSARFVGLWVWTPLSLICEFCVLLSSKGPCVVLITRPEESYEVCCV